jgi:hypothetical protein
VTERLQKFRQYEQNLNLDTGLQAILDTAVDRDAINAAVGEALGEPPVATSVTTPPVTTTVLPPAEAAETAAPTEAPLASMGVQGSGTEQDPITFTTETGMTAEMYQAVPAGAYYKDPTGRVSQRREGSRVANNDRGDGDPLGSGIVVPASREEYDALPSGTRWRDPDGNIRIKP